MWRIREVRVWRCWYTLPTGIACRFRKAIHHTGLICSPQTGDHISTDVSRPAWLPFKNKLSPKVAVEKLSSYCDIYFMFVISWSFDFGLKEVFYDCCHLVKWGMESVQIHSKAMTRKQASVFRSTHIVARVKRSSQKSNMITTLDIFFFTKSD